MGLVKLCDKCGSDADVRVVWIKAQASRSDVKWCRLGYLCANCLGEILEKYGAECNRSQITGRKAPRKKRAEEESVEVSASVISYDG